MRFWKMEGLGNDFVVLTGPVTIDPAVIRGLCDRRRGVGADGLLAISPIGRESVRMEYWNADGSTAEMCGNGLRCVARFAVERGLVDGPELTIHTAVGPRRAEVGEEVVRVEMGRPSVGAGREAGGHRFTPASVGNPHAVIRVEAVADAPVTSVGPELEVDPAFPDRTNVEFLEVVAPGSLRLRVWERGVGETLACGSGAVAAAAVARAWGDTTSRISVALPGGVATVAFDGDVAWLEGPARTVFEGTWA